MVDKKLLEQYLEESKKPLNPLFYILHPNMIKALKKCGACPDNVITTANLPIK